MNPVEITVTCSSAEEAQKIGSSAVEARLAACSQIWPISSCYRWNDDVVSDTEYLLLLKTVDDHFEAVARLVRQLHSYELPAIVMVPITATGPGYLDWIVSETSTASAPTS